MLSVSRMMPVLIAAAALSISAGCSVYSISDRYDIESVRPGMAVPQADAHAAVWVDEHIKLMLVGPPCLPFIPVAVSGLSSDIITIKSTLSLTKEHSFSVNARPCLHSDSSATICANTLAVAARAEFPAVTMPTTPQESTMASCLGAFGEHLVKEAHKTDPFAREDDLVLELSGKDVLRRVDTAELYEHYYYKGKPPWKSLQVTFIFSVPCDGPCPDKFTLDARDFLTLDGERIIDAEYVYVRVHRKQYQYMAL